MKIVELLKADECQLKRQASTNGGEYSAPCPFCGGKDRFRVWPGSGRYWCRACGKQGDAIQYLRERRGLSFREACALIGHDPGPRRDTHPAPATWEPRETKTPDTLWQAKARAFLDEAIKVLWGPQGEKMRQWLRNKKGLNDATIKGACLGLALADTFEPRAMWGLDPSIKDDGTERRQWIPAGLAIPLISKGDIHRLRIRRSDPGDDARYVIVSGSSAAPMVWGEDRGAAIIVESELDGLLLSQEAGDLVGVVAMGTATAKPDIQTHELLKDAPLILVSLDTDVAGAKAAWKFWPDTYGKKARRWPAIKGKDASEARLNGLDLRAWIIAGMFGTEERFERFCIQTIDGGLSDEKALVAQGLQPKINSC